MRARLAIRFAPLVAAAGLVVPGPAVATGATLAFAPQVRLTPDSNFGGYEPGLVIDRFGNIVVTAHKQNHGDAISPDTGTLPIRAQSWLWMSSDGGATFPDMPGLAALNADRLDFGDEGDVAVDDAGHVYFVDTKVADISFTRWLSSGRGQVSEQFTTPALPTATPVDDRPWVIAHGNGVVQYLANVGDKVTYGPGRYTSYMSYDGGTTFDHIGVNLPDSGWCRPVADHRAGSKLIVVFCTNDGGANDETTNPCTPGFTTGTLWSYVSTDDGKSFTRYKAGDYNPCNPVDSWPSMAEDAAGNIYALYLDAPTTGAHGPTGSLPGVGDPLSTIVASTYNLNLFRSSDHGKTWTKRQVTPEAGPYHYAWLDVAPDGTIGIVYYHAKDANSDWFAFAGVARDFTAPFISVKVSPTKVSTSGFGPFGDFFECMFGPDGRLNVVWTDLSTIGGQSATYGLNSDIYYAHTVGSVTTTVPPPTPTPTATPTSTPAPGQATPTPTATATPAPGLANTGASRPAPVAGLLVAGLAGAAALTRRRRGRRRRSGRD